MSTEDLIKARNDQAIAVATLPDGSPWHPRKHWDRFLRQIQDFTAATYREQPDEAKAPAGRREGDLAPVP